MSCKPMGEAEVAVFLGVQPNTVHVWRKRGVLPPEDGFVSGNPYWHEATVERWAKDTKRL